jgi:hypothetical protein
MEHLDYKDKIPGKYPDPKDRMVAKDFPSPGELFTYGEDFPMPESMDDLRCRYNEDERVEDGELVNPLVLDNLSGYKVPPLGLTAVYMHGGGGKKGFAYPPGTFRENKHTMNMELGSTPEKALEIREDNRVKKMIAGIREALEERDYEFDGRTNADVLGMVTKVAMLKVIDDDSAREARMFVELMYKILGTKEDNKERREDKAFDLASQSMEAVQQVLDYTEKMLNKDVVDIPVYDVDED